MCSAIGSGSYLFTKPVKDISIFWEVFNVLLIFFLCITTWGRIRQQKKGSQITEPSRVPLQSFSLFTSDRPLLHLFRLSVFSPSPSFSFCSIVARILEEVLKIPQQNCPTERTRLNWLTLTHWGIALDTPNYTLRCLYLSLFPRFISAYGNSHSCTPLF